MSRYAITTRTFGGCLRVIQEASNKIIKQMAGQSNQVDRIYPISIFSAEAAKILNTPNAHEQLTETDLQTILTYLARDKSAIIYDDQVGHLRHLQIVELIRQFKTVKFKGLEDTSSTLSTQDRTIASLKSLIADLNGQIALLSTEVSTLSDIAQTAVRNKNRVSALAALRSKKLNETALFQRTNTLSHLEGVYNKIGQAADQVAIVRIMEASAGVLRSLHGEIGGVENVEDVMDGLRDEMSKVDEISTAIEAGGQEQSVTDEDAVDKELESLERQAKSEREKKGAQETQERLASIGESGEAKGPKEPRRGEFLKGGISHVQALNKAPASPIEDGIDTLNRLSLNDDRPPVGSVSEMPENLAESIPHAALET